MSKNEILEMLMTNAIVYQSDGFQMGYAEAISDLTSIMHNYSKYGNGDALPCELLDALVELGENLAEKKRVANKNAEGATEKGYMLMHVTNKDKVFGINLYVTEVLEENVEIN